MSLSAFFGRLELGKANVGLKKTGGAKCGSWQVGDQRPTDTPRPGSPYHLTVGGFLIIKLAFSKLLLSPLGKKIWYSPLPPTFIPQSVAVISELCFKIIFNCLCIVQFAQGN